jgi:hypothetical protein
MTRYDPGNYCLEWLLDLELRNKAMVRIPVMTFELPQDLWSPDLIDSASLEMTVEDFAPQVAIDLWLKAVSPTWTCASTWQTFPGGPPDTPGEQIDPKEGCIPAGTLTFDVKHWLKRQPVGAGARYAFALQGRAYGVVRGKFYADDHGNPPANARPRLVLWYYRVTPTPSLTPSITSTPTYTPTLTLSPTPTYTPSPTATYTPSVTPSTTRIPRLWIPLLYRQSTPTPTPTPVCTDVIKDGGFSLGRPNPYWTEQSNRMEDQLIRYCSPTPPPGLPCIFPGWYAYLGGWPGRTHTLSQSVRLPARLESMELRFSYYPWHDADSAVEVLLVAVSDTPITITLLSEADLPPNPTRTPIAKVRPLTSAELTRLRGYANARLCFRMTTAATADDGRRASGIYIDDVELIVCRVVE